MADKMADKQAQRERTQSQIKFRLPKFRDKMPNLIKGESGIAKTFCKAAHAVDPACPAEAPLGEGG